MSEKEALKKKTLSRNGHRLVVSNTIAKAKEILPPPGEEAAAEIKTKLKAYLNTIEKKRADIAPIDKEIEELTSAEGVEKEILDRSDFEAVTEEIICFITEAIKEKVVAAPPLQQGASFIQTRSPTDNVGKVKLPKLPLSTFHGNPTEWTSFWDSFSSTIHECTTLADIDKFKYLKQSLSGEAARTISGLTLSSENYKEAIEVLENRFGDKQTIISRHIDVLTELPKITSNEDLQQLRRLYDKTECTVRSLRGIGITTEHYSVFLTPIIMKKIPPELRLLLSRKLSNEWDLNGLLKALGEELALREKCAFASSESASGTTKSRPNVNRGQFGNSQPSTSSTLMVNNEKQGGRNYNGVPFCLFCGNKHYSSSCITVTDPNARKKIIRERKRCFVCLRGGHISRDCRSTSKCFRCQGKHHVSICGSHADIRAVDNAATRSVATPHKQNRSQQVTQNTSHNPQSPSVSTHISTSCNSSNTAVLLQTARAKVHRVDSENEFRFLFTKVLRDKKVERKAANSNDKHR